MLNVAQHRMRDNSRKKAKCCLIQSESFKSENKITALRDI